MGETRDERFVNMKRIGRKYRLNIFPEDKEIFEKTILGLYTTMKKLERQGYKFREFPAEEMLFR